MSMGEMHQFCRNRRKSLFWNRDGITSLLQLPLQTIIQNDWQNDRYLDRQFKAAAVLLHNTRYQFPADAIEREFDWLGVDGG